MALYSKNIVFLQVQTIQQGPYETVVCIAIVILYNSQVADPQRGSFAFPSFLSFSISIFSKIFRVSIFYICSLATTYFIQNFLFPCLISLLALLYLNLLLPLVLPLFLLNGFMPFINRLLPTKRPLLYIPYVPYIPIQSSDIIRYRFQPVKAWDSLMLKVKNTKKAPVSPQFITCYFYLYNLVYRYSCSY